MTRDSQGNATHVESVVFHKEERRKQRESFAKIFEAQNHLALIANYTQSGIFMMDPQGYCIYMNSAAEKITGFTFDEIYDYTFHASVHSCRPDGAVYPIYDCPVFCHQQAGTEAKNESESQRYLFTKMVTTMILSTAFRQPVSILQVAL